MQSDVIWNRARANLVITTEDGNPDLFLWEHSVRTAQYARRIIKLPEVQAVSPDKAAVIAAALYHDAGWVERVQEGEVTRGEILIGSVLENHFEQGAVMLESGLANLLPPDSVARASQAVRALNDRNSESIERHVVRDADNLDEFGVPSLWLTIRRDTLVGKGIQAAIDTWRRRNEYRFWDARLRDSFHFASVRALAEKRLKEFDRLMLELEAQHEGDDIEVQVVCGPTA